MTFSPNTGVRLVCFCYSSAMHAQHGENAILSSFWVPGNIQGFAFLRCELMRNVRNQIVMLLGSSTDKISCLFFVV